MDSKDTVASLIGIICVSKAAHPEHFPDANAERRNDFIDALEPKLRAEAAKVGFAYRRPILQKDGEELLARMPTLFVTKYGIELAYACRAGMESVVL